MLDDSWRNGGSVTLVELDGDEGGDEDTEEDKEYDDSGVRPWVLAATPLKGKQGTDNTGNKDGSAFEIHESCFRLPAECGHFLVARRTFEEEKDKEDCDCTKRKVDVETWIGVSRCEKFAV